LWTAAARLAGIAVGSATIAFAIKSQLHARPLMVLVAATSAYILSYVGLVWNLDLLNESERYAIAGWLRRTGGTIAQVLAFRRAG